MTLEAFNGLALNRTATATNYTTVKSDGIVGVTDTSVARTITLGSVAAFAGNTVTIKDESGGAGTNSITVATEGSENIDGAATLVISTNYGVARLYSDGANWFTHMAAPAGNVDIGTRVFHSVGQSIATATWVAHNFDSERWDTDGIHDNATNNTRLTAKTAGKYSISATLTFGSGTGSRQIKIRLNGVTDIAMDGRPPISSGSTPLTIETKYNLAVNDYVECLVFQNSGGALSTSKLANFSPEFMMQKIG